MRLRTAVVLLSLLAAYPLPARGSKDVERWAQEFETSDPARQVMVARLLGRSKKAAAVEPLLKAFDIRGKPPRLSLAIITSLGELKDFRAMPPLLGAWDFLNSTRLQLGQELPANIQVLRPAIVEAAGSIGGARARQILEQAINDSDPQVVQKAALALGRQRDKEGVDALIALLGKGGGVAQAAFEALGAMDDQRGNAALKNFVGSDDAVLRIQAAYALSLSEGRSYRGALEDALVDEKIERANKVLAAYYLARLGDRDGVDYLALAAEKGRPEEKLLAIQALGKCGHAKAAEPLIGTLATPDASTRLLVVRALGQLGGKEAVAALRGLTQDLNATVKATARQLLADLGHEP